jgi:hypothetical protein
MPSTACTRATTSLAQLVDVARLGADDHVEGSGHGLGLLHARDVDDVLGDLGRLADLGLDRGCMPSPQVPTSLRHAAAALCRE